jgi:hypothetical protein
MAVFLLAEGTHVGSDKHLQILLGRGGGQEVKSTEVYKPKDPGVLGLRVINTRVLIKHLPNVKMDVAPVATNEKIRTFGIGEL